MEMLSSFTNLKICAPLTALDCVSKAAQVLFGEGETVFEGVVRLDVVF